ncbi:AMP-binding protein [Pseudonocardia parietis]|uniref:Fatty-acyl-CoA synthase n=1 Tax=Pseudonocardia parietis TaxID=570936 RepID=A0ABS4VRG4_9PSEU|nr:AMP-binding protein [Pseudonocardia parietis]MBP2366510.1 fatty-acyl-CoA synthase [Pseudonocardia parietis]
MVIRVTTLGDIVDEQAARSDATALVMPGIRFTYPELAARIDHVAACLLALGVRPRGTVGFLMPNTPDYVLALLATAKIGAVGVPINGRFKAHELSHVIDHADIDVLLVAADPHGTDYAGLVEQVFPDLAGGEPGRLRLEGAPRLRAVVNLSGTAPGMLDRAAFDAGAATVDPDLVEVLRRRVRVRDVALLIYTSGTTARPKGCLLTHEALVRQAENVARTRFLLGPSDALWNPLPLYHCGGIVPMLGCFSAGAKYCHAGHFEPGAALRTIVEERCTVLYPAFETIWRAVLDHPGFLSADLSAVRIVQNIATPERLAQFEEAMPRAVQVSSYGSTECATNLTLPLPDDPADIRMRTLGRVVDGMELKIVDPETGDDLGEDTMGELCFRGYSMFEGYYKDPDQTAATIDGDGWFHSGDRAMLVDGGNLVYGGRIKDMLKVGGENVAAIEIEDFLARHPAVALVQVVAAPDARYQEIPAAYVQLAPGASLTHDELVAFCRGAIASYKIPRYLRLVTEWPLSGTKIKKVVLREWITEELARDGVIEAPRLDERVDR